MTDTYLNWDKGSTRSTYSKKNSNSTKFGSSNKSLMTAEYISCFNSNYFKLTIRMHDNAYDQSGTF